MHSILTALRELEGRSPECATADELASAVFELMSPALQAYEMSLVLARPGCVGPECVALRARNAPTDEDRAQLLLGAFPLIERELTPIAQIVARGQIVFDLRELAEPDHMRKTVVYNEFWRPLGLEQQVVGLVTDGSRFQGHVCFVRGGTQPAFDSDHKYAMSAIRRSIQQWVDDREPVAEAMLLAALSESLDVICAVFDETGQVLWLSRRALELAGGSVARAAGMPIIRHWSTAFHRWRALAMAVLTGADPVESKGRLRLECSIHAHKGCRVAVVIQHERSFREEMRAADNVDVPQGLKLWKLTPRQEEIVQLMTRGLSNKELAAALGCTRRGVEAHLTRIYQHVGVSSRTELLSALMIANARS